MLPPTIRRDSQPGFTLIELLIVVAIIAILAAIAVPNFLEAQTRAKVSRCRADMRTVATGIESYAVDANRPPLMRHRTSGLRPVNDYVSPPGTTARTFNQATLPLELTTPIAYLSSLPKDPFKDLRAVRISATTGNVTDAGIVVTTDESTKDFIYNNVFDLVTDTTQYPGYGFNDLDLKEYGTWRIVGIGPDKQFYGSIGRRVYDPTNGTVTPGDVIRTQSSSAGDSKESTSGSN